MERDLIKGLDQERLSTLSEGLSEKLGQAAWAFRRKAEKLLVNYSQFVMHIGLAAKMRENGWA